MHPDGISTRSSDTKKPLPLCCPLKLTLISVTLRVGLFEVGMYGTDVVVCTIAVYTISSRVVPPLSHPFSPFPPLSTA